MATEVGNIHIGLYVDVGESRRFTDVANIVERDSRRMNTSLGNTTNSVRALRGQMSQSLRFRIAQESLRGLTQATNEVTRLRAAITGLAAISGVGLTGAFSASYLVQTADKARLLSNQIKTVTADTAEFASVQDQLFGVSQRTRSSLEATTQIYARTARATESFRYSQEKLLRITETVQKAFAIGGATPQEAQGAAIQLSQGIASDRFGGEEFRSVAENAPVLLRGIAESMGVTIGKLREMSAEGQLTARVVTEAIVKASARIDKEFAMTVPTVAQSVTLLDNAFLRYIGATDQAYGFTKTLSNAIMGLSENFEDVMYWVTRATGLLVAFYASRKLFMSGRDKITSTRAMNEGIREEIADRVEQQEAMGKRLVEIDKEIAKARASVNTAIDTGETKRMENIRSAEDKQVAAVKRVNELHKERFGILERLQRAQSEEVGNLTRQVEIARQRVRDDQLRVVQAQEAAMAEERNLRARQAQAVAKANNAVDAATGKSVDASSRVKQAEDAIKAERELARVRIAGEIESRRQQLVTGTQRLRDVQAQIAELRSVQDLSGFDQTYGKQYRSLLREQQKAMKSTSDLRNELGGLQTSLKGIEDGTGTTKGISAAMKQHANATKQAEAAVKSLAAAEKLRNEAAAAPIKGKTLDARLAAEAKEIDRYKRSVDDLQTRMRVLREATAGAFNGSSVQKVVREIDNFDKKIVAAQNNLKEATAAVARAQTDGGEKWATALQAQARATSQINGLQKEATAILERQAVTTARIAAAQQRLNMLRRIGGNVLDFFGGWTGLAITGALVAATALMAKFGAEAQKSEEETARITKQLQDLGYLTSDAADEMGRFAKNASDGRISKLQVELDSLNKDMDKTVQSMKDMSLDNVLPGSLSGASFFDFNRTMTLDQVKLAERNDAVATSIKKIRDEMVSTKSMSEQSRKALEDMALANPDIASITLSLITMGERMNAIVKATTDWTDAIKKAREEANKTPQERYANTRTQAAKNQQEYERSMSAITGPEIAESERSEYEARIRRIMDGLIKDAEKLGKVMLDSDARRAAETILANETAKKGLRDLIGLFEGTDKGRGYNETLGYGKFTGGDVNLTSMTLREVLDLQRKMLAQTRALPKDDPNYNSSAVGRYQIVSTTLKGLVDKLGLSLEEVFTPELQDRLADQLIRGRGRDAGGLRSEWAGLNKASDQQILGAFDETSIGLPKMDQSVKDWIDGIKDLNLKRQIADLKEFDQNVLQTAQSMGASKEELQQYIAAAQSGDMSQVPARFREIVSAMRDIESTDIKRQFDELQTTNLVGFLSDANQKVVEVARSLGIAEDKIKAFIIASRNGDQVPPIFQRIQVEVENMAYNDRLKDYADGAADAFGGLVRDLAHGEDGLKNFAQRMADLALEFLVIQPLINSLQNSFRGFAGSFSGGSGGGGFFSGIGNLLSSVFGGGTGSGANYFPPAPKKGFDGGGWTGPGGKYQPAGTVHADEFVFTKEAVDRFGVEQLNALHEYMKTGNMGALAKALPQLMGGDSGAMRLPNYDVGGYASSTPVNTMSSTTASGSDPAGTGAPTEILVSLSPELVGQILNQAQGQAAKLVQKSNKNRSETFMNGGNPT